MQLISSGRLLPLIAPLLLISNVAHAQAEPGVGGKGIVGGALLGGEAVTLTEAALGINPAWAYYLGGGAGLIGGGVAGYFLEDSLSPKSAMYLLSAGMLLAIPTTVAVLNATSYDAPLEYTQDMPPLDDRSESDTTFTPTPTLPTMPPATAMPPKIPVLPGSPAPSAPQSAPATTPAAPALGPSGTQPQSSRAPRKHRRHGFQSQALASVSTALLDLSGSKLAFGIPAIAIQGTYTRREMAMYGIKQQTEVRVPLIQLAF